MPKNTTGKWSVPPEIRALKPVGTLVKRGHDDQHYYVYEHFNYKGEDGKWHTKNGRLIGYITPEAGFIPREGSQSEADGQEEEELGDQEVSEEKENLGDQEVSEEKENLGDQEVPEEEPDFVRDCEAGEITKSATEPSRHVETMFLEEEDAERGSASGENTKSALEPGLKAGKTIEESIEEPIQVSSSSSLMELEYGPYACAIALSGRVLEELRQCFSPQEARELFILGILMAVNGDLSPALLARTYAQSFFLKGRKALQMGEKEILRVMESVKEGRREREAYQGLQLKISGPVLLFELYRKSLFPMGEEELWGPLPFYGLSIRIRDGENQRPLACLESEQAILEGSDLEEISKRYSLEGKLFLFPQEGLFFPDGGKGSFSGKAAYLLPLAPEGALEERVELKERFLYRQGGQKTVIEYGCLNEGKERILFFRDIERSLLGTEQMEELLDRGARGYTREGLKALEAHLGLLVVRTNEKNRSPRELFETYVRGCQGKNLMERGPGIEGFVESGKNLFFQTLFFQSSFSLGFSPIEGREGLYGENAPQREGYAFMRLLAAQIRYEMEKALREREKGMELKELLLQARRIRLSFPRDRDGTQELDEGQEEEGLLEGEICPEFARELKDLGISLELYKKGFL